MTSGVDVLLIANNFPPVRGGSAAVYASLAQASSGRIMVMAPQHSYLDGLPLIGWREHDRGATFRVHRRKLLRTPLHGPKGTLGRAAFLMRDALNRVRLLRRLTILILQERPRAVCVGELLASGWIIRLLRWVPAIRTIAYVHGEEITTDDGYDAGRRHCRVALSAADGIVVVSPFTRSAVLAMLGSRASERVRLIENGVDATKFRPGAKRPDLVERFGLAGHFVFVSVCRLLEKKGVDHALRAFAELGDTSCRFVVVGTGEFEAVLKELVIELGISHQVAFAGQVAEEDLADCYRIGDVFVMPNRALPNGDTEGFGLVFLEANGCGVPVVAGRDGGSIDAVHHGLNGLVVDGASVSAIADAMRMLRIDDGLRTRLRQGGLDLVARAGWEQRAHEFLSFSAALGAARSQ